MDNISSLNIMQFNIRNWKSNKYLLQVDLCNYNPDIILLNETSNTEENIKIRGFYTFQCCKERYAGVAILIKHN